MPRWVVANEEQHEPESSSDEEVDEEEAEEGADSDTTDLAAAGPSGVHRQGDVIASTSRQPGGKKGKITIALGQKLVCHVCGKSGHNAGFVGSIYMDCPNKPCYLCKKPGHTTMTCPHRIAPDHDCSQSASVSKHGILASIFQRSLDAKRREMRLPMPGWQVDAAVLKLHSRRCTCLQFHPSRDNLVLSGDKHGQIAVWDHLKVYERTVWRLNKAITNNMSFLPSIDGMACCSASADGTLKVFDVETGLDRELLNMNPDGWIEGVSNERNWIMLYGLDVCRQKNLVTVGDSKGVVHFVDARCEAPLAHHQVHNKGKVNSIHYSPIDCNLMVSASNDWTARLIDIRRLSSSAPSSTDSKGKEIATAATPFELARIEHPKVVNSAYFSPTSGRKLMTTCIDNRIRVWDNLLAIDRGPDREIVHSHDFNRYLTPFRAEWDPKDPDERLFVIGRYISEDFGGTALHPVDLLDASTGKLLDQLKDPNLTTISPVNKFHPRLDLIISGSSRSLYAWRPEIREDKIGCGTGSTKKQGEEESKDTTLLGSASYVFYDAGTADDTEKKKRNKAGASAVVQMDDPSPKQKPGGKTQGKKGSTSNKEKGAAKAGKKVADTKSKPDPRKKGKKKEEEDKSNKRKRGD